MSHDSYLDLHPGFLKQLKAHLRKRFVARFNEFHGLSGSSRLDHLLENLTRRIAVRLTARASEEIHHRSFPMSSRLEVRARWKTIRLSQNEMQIVRFLYENGETHAYGVATGIGKEGLHSSIYVYLNRLEKKGVIESKTVMRVRNGIQVPHRLVKLKQTVRKSYEENRLMLQEGDLAHA